MISLSPSRARPSDRAQTPSDKSPSARVKSYLAPVGGWVTNENYAADNGPTAAVLENFLPTATGIKPRGGSISRVNVSGEVKYIFEYGAGGSDQYFVADEDSVYPFSPTTPADTSLTASITGQTGHHYAHVEMQTDGGSYLSLINGADKMQIYDGTSFQQVTDVSTPFAITGVDTALISQIWVYGSRQFMIEQSTMNAWYLGTNSVAGAATKLPLAGVFNNGGNLYFGATWSSDSGDGLDDRCVFFTDKGEFAVYRGDPASASTWSLDGVFDLGEVLGPRAVVSVGGDLLICTKSGITPISAAVQKGPEELSLYSISRPIQPDWQREALLTGAADGWRFVKWASRNLAIVAPPIGASTQSKLFAVNLETKAWSSITGWDLTELAQVGDVLYYGTSAGVVFQADIGGQDDGVAFSCSFCASFDRLGGAGIKVGDAVQFVFKHLSDINPKFSLAKDYRPAFPSAPNAATVTIGTDAVWDVATWDADYWASDEADQMVRRGLAVVSGHGDALAVQMQLTSGASARLNCEFMAYDLQYSQGAMIG